jgi:polyisoprenoid-binding protein YceI
VLETESSPPAKRHGAPPSGGAVPLPASRDVEAHDMFDDSALIDIRAGDDVVPLSGSWTVDPTHSSLEFVARYAVFTRIRGRFTVFAGSVTIDPRHLDSTCIDVEVDAASVDTASAVRDAHLRSGDFFDVENHPTITFRSRGAALFAPGRYTLNGDLAIRGVAQPVRLEVVAFGRAPDVVGNPRLAFKASGKVQRALWGITWNAPVRGGGVALAQGVELDLDVSLLPSRN